MFYMIMGEDHPDSLQKRLQNRPAHLERLNALRDSGHLLLSGRFPAIDNEDPGPAGFTGSLIIAEFESLQQAQSWADAEPYLTAGVFKQVIVKPFQKVLP